MFLLLLLVLLLLCARGTTQVVCILGSPVTADGKPLLHMRSRLDHALAALREGGWLAHHAIIVTGGRPKTYGSAGVHAEADVMRE